MSVFDIIVDFGRQDRLKTMNTVDGKDMPKRKYIKILSESLYHNGFQYKEGLNIDTVPFNPSGSCLGGGLYFTIMDNLLQYMFMGPKIADVEIPPDSRVYLEPCGTKWKADKIIITNIRHIGNMTEWSDVKFCENWVRQLYEVNFYGNSGYIKAKSEGIKKYFIDLYNNWRERYRERNDLKYKSTKKHLRNILDRIRDQL
jgi:hypothetical protein